MNRSWLVHASVVLCCFGAPARLYCQSESVTVAAAAAGVLRATYPDLPPGLAENPDIPPAQQDLMRNARGHYLQGSNLIKSGECAKARVEFNKAVEVLLLSEWSLGDNPDLNRFFQDLIHRIQQDESKYLQPEEQAEEKPEGAVVDELSKLDLIPIKIDPSLKDAFEADLANTRYDIPITLNEQVLQSLNFWLNKGRTYFHDGLIRSGRYREMIEKTFREESIPLDLMYLAQVESLFKTNALSKARARGMWQFGKWTAIRYGLKVNSYIDERSDPEKSTRAAAKYLNDLYAMFKDWNLVLAAYNWGEGKVQRLVDRSGLTDFWAMMELRRNFPRETKNHVPLIQASVILARNPEKYGFPKDLDPPESYDRISVPRPIDLRAAAKLLNTSLDELKGLNPALRGLSTPADYPGFELKVPAGSDAEASRKVAELPAVRFKPPPEYPSRHKVQPGDTLTGIAARYHTSAKALQDVNGIKSPNSLRVGSYIRVPAIRSRPATAARATVPHKRVTSGTKTVTTKTKRKPTPSSPNSKLAATPAKKTAKANP
jgi:membrane-bound lytic murein transglycosylase D